MQEEWKAIPSAPGYWASDQGKIIGQRGYVLKAHLSTQGYWQVRADNRARRVHRLVCEAFHGHAPFAADACHLDGNKLNNQASNLKWGSRAENLSHMEGHGTVQRGERNGRAKLSAEQVLQIRNSPLSQRRLAAAFGLSKASIWNIQTHKTWSHV